MMARIWWKESRALWPIALTVALACWACQLFLATYGGDAIADGVLPPIALGWAVLYALVAASASFAGERENKMMLFLDALPVGREVLWASKVSFAVGSSLLLALILFGVSQVNNDSNAHAGDWFFQYGFLLVEAVVWGAFWSSFTSTSIAAAIGTVFSLAALAMVSYVDADDPARNLLFSFFIVNKGPVVAIHVGSSLVALLLSLYFLKREMPLLGRSRLLAPRSIGPTLAAPTADDPLARRGISWREWIGPGPAFLSVAWETWQGGRTLWLQSMGLALAALLWASTLGHPGDNLLLVVLVFFALLAMGASIFGAENAAGTTRFLDHLGVSPGLVWRAKAATWAAMLAPILALVIFEVYGGVLGTGPRREAHPLETAFVVLSIALLPVTVAGLAGMVFARRITSALIALIATLALMATIFSLFGAGMIPLWATFVPSAVLVAISRAWAGDWIGPREGPRRYLKLGALVAVPFTLMAGWYVVYRATSVQWISAPLTYPSNVTAARTPPTATALAYRDAHKKLPTALYNHDAQMVATEGEDVSTVPDAAELLRQAADPLLEVRKAAADPAASIPSGPPGRFLAANSGYAQEVLTVPLVANALGFEGRAFQDRGEMPKAWDDIVAQFRIARQLMDGAEMIYADQLGLTIHGRAIGLGYDWARDPRASAADLRRAFDEFRAIPEPGSIARTIAQELGWIDEALGRGTTEEWVDYLNPPRKEGREDIGNLSSRILTSWFTAPWWERTRARAILHQLATVAIPAVDLTPHQRNSLTQTWADIRQPLSRFPQSPILMQVFPYLPRLIDSRDFEVTSHRIFALYLALRVWQVEHGNAPPETLSEVAPMFPSGLPTDPYTGGSFSYRKVDESVGVVKFLRLIATGRRDSPKVREIAVTGQYVLAAKVVDSRAFQQQPIDRTGEHSQVLALPPGPGMPVPPKPEGASPADAPGLPGGFPSDGGMGAGPMGEMLKPL